jgi:hypothetical protein
MAFFYSVHSASATKPLIAFTTCLGSSPKVLGLHQTLVFDHVILNEGDAYDPRHGIFRAPVSGVYQFVLTFLNDGINRAYIEIVKDGTQITYGYSNDGDNNMGIVQVNIRVAANQDVWCRSAYTSSARSYLDEDGKFSCFSGHIISL